jgi:hypothetical protein
VTGVFGCRSAQEFSHCSHEEVSSIDSVPAIPRFFLRFLFLPWLEWAPLKWDSQLERSAVTVMSLCQNDRGNLIGPPASTKYSFSPENVQEAVQCLRNANVFLHPQLPQPHSITGRSLSDKRSISCRLFCSLHVDCAVCSICGQKAWGVFPVRMEGPLEW